MNNFKRRFGGSDEPEYIFEVSSTRYTASSASSSYVDITVTSKLGDENIPWIIVNTTGCVNRASLLNDTTLRVIWNANSDTSSSITGTAVIEQPESGISKTILITVPKDSERSVSYYPVGNVTYTLNVSVGGTDSTVYTNKESGNNNEVTKSVNLNSGSTRTYTVERTVIIPEMYQITEYYSGRKESRKVDQDVVLTETSTKQSMSITGTVVFKPSDLSYYVRRIKYDIMPSYLEYNGKAIWLPSTLTTHEFVLTDWSAMGSLSNPNTRTIVSDNGATLTIVALASSNGNTGYVKIGPISFSKSIQQVGSLPQS